MTQLPYINLTLLASVATLLNLYNTTQNTYSLPPPSQEECAASAITATSRSMEKLGIKPLAGQIVGCDGPDCTYSHHVTETYCQDTTVDCDGLLGWNESYEWARRKDIYQCGTPGTPGYGWFVACNYWAITDCCNNGATGLPPTNCSYPGTQGCTTR